MSRLEMAIDGGGLPVGMAGVIVVPLTATVKIRETCQMVAALPNWRFVNTGCILLVSLVIKKVHDSKCFTPLPLRSLKVLT